PFAELRFGGKMLRQMDGIAIAGELREADHVGGGNGLRQRLGHADREILEIENAQLQDHQTATVARISRMLHRGDRCASAPRIPRGASSRSGGSPQAAASSLSLASERWSAGRATSRPV